MLSIISFIKMYCKVHIKLKNNRYYYEPTNFEH